ncbi:MAG: hypothetical protein GC161_13055 [Planctomycetaceae bacterium]|nr:hypothetical protein [Planctomycetaceae bacterium]
MQLCPWTPQRPVEGHPARTTRPRNLLWGLALAATAAVSAAAPASAQAPRFEHRHGGVVHGIWMYGANGGATAEDGGRIRYCTDGQTWLLAEVPADVRGMLRGVMFLDDEKGYCVGDGGVVLKTTNGGEDWAWVNQLNPITSLKTDSFDVLLDEPAGLYDIVMFDEDEGYAVGNDGVVVYTADGWDNWTNLDLVEESINPVDFYDLYMWDADNGVFVGDYGTIRKMTTDEFDVVTISQPTISPALCFGSGGSTEHGLEWWSVQFLGNNGVIAGGLGFNNGFILTSSDDGDTWSQISLLVPYELAETQLSGAAPTHYAVGQMVGGLNVAGYGSSVWDLLLGGIGAGPKIFDQCDPLVPTEFLNDDGTGVPVSLQTLPQSTADINGRPPLQAMFSLTHVNKWIGGQFGIIQRWDSGTDSWNHQATVNHQRLSAGDFKDQDVGCVIGQGNSIVRTADGGATWSVVHPTSGLPNLAHSGRDLDLSSNGYGVAVGTDSFFAYSTNSGAAWTVVPRLDLPSGWVSTMEACKIAPSSTVAYVAGPGGTAFKVDLAASPLVWTDVTVAGMSTSGDTVLGLDFIDSSTGYAVGTERTAYVTSNGGANWTAVTVSGTTAGQSFRAVATWDSGTKAAAVGTGGIVYYRDGGAFNAVSLGSHATDVAFNDVEILDGGDEVMICGDAGQIRRYASSTWSSPKSMTSQNIHALSFDADDHGFAIGQQFVILEYN